jgi:thiol-disulfide isomerase/thioredoxin
MKNCLFLFLSFLIISCGSENVNLNEDAKAELDVNISNTTDSLLVISSRTFNSEISLTNGASSSELNIPENGLYYLQNGRKYVNAYLEKGKKISISYDLNDLEGSYTASGDLGNENQYLQDKDASNKENRIDSKTKFTSSEEDYLAYAQADRTRQSELLSKAKGFENGLSKTFLTMEKNNILYDWANQLANYESGYRYYSKEEEFKASDKIKAYKSEVNLNDAEALISPQFKQFVSSHLYNEANAQIEEKEELKGKDVFVHSFSLIPELIQDAKVKDHFYFQVISDILDFAGVDKAVSLMEDFSANCKNEEFKNKFEEKFKEWENLVQGKPAPVFEYADIQGTMVSLKEFKGKNVYIDVWATWCGPCRQEQPFLEELQVLYKDNPNIVFTSISIDEDKAAWEKMVTEKELKGVHLIADNAWSSGIVKDYLIKGIPRFMIIDADGNILNVNAPRPSSDELKEVLQGLADKT